MSLSTRAAFALRGSDPIWIRDVEAVPLRFVATPETAFRSRRGGRIDGMLLSLVTVTSDRRLAGYGAVYAQPELVKVVVEDILRPLVVGRDAREVEDLWSRMELTTGWYGRGGVVSSAIGGVDVALWDLVGRSTERSVSQLLGASRSRVAAYASAVQFDDLVDVPARISGFVSQGFRDVKVRAGINPEYDFAVAELAAQLIPRGGSVMVDGVKRLPLAHAVELVQRYEALGVRWFEEPLPPDEIEDYAALRRTTSVPIAAGESETCLLGFKRLLAADAIDVAQPDVSRAGGITEVRNIAAQADAHDVIVATHTWSDPLSVVANAHVVASIPNGDCVEVNALGTPFFTRLFRPTLEIEDGYLRLPDAPGIGLEPNPEVVEEFTLTSGRVPDGFYGDMWFGPDSEPDRGPYPGRSLEAHFAETA
jgi:L-alanine-DL-glutamate epimerase-like enolase superfamily enzyme